MKKNYILDTNVLLHDPRALQQFEDNNVILPIYVIEELDRFKKDNSELGRNARWAARLIDTFRQKGQLSGEGVPMGDGEDEGFLRVLFASGQMLHSDSFQKLDSPDSKILAVAMTLREEEPDLPTIVISKDTNLRIRANALGLEAVDYEPEFTTIDELYTGYREYNVPGEVIDEIYDLQTLNMDTLSSRLTGEESAVTSETDPDDPAGRRWYPNQFFLLKDEANPKHSAVARLAPNGEEVVPLSRRGSEPIWGIWPKNKEQRFAFDLLLDESVQLVSLVGKAGTGKTLLAIAAGLQQTVEEQRYQKLLVSRPIFPLGRDLGFLPGTLEEKLLPWMKPIFDNVEFLMGLSAADKRKGRSHEELIEMGMLQIEPLTYIRGRSIPNQFMIIDEAQNLTPHEIKTIVTRVGEGTKIVFTGDPYQIDHPYLDASDNGLVHTVKRFQSEGIAGHITLRKGERSELAELAANLL
jgi:PhoH-like ATPase